MGFWWGFALGLGVGTAVASFGAVCVFLYADYRGWLDFDGDEEAE